MTAKCPVCRRDVPFQLDARFSTGESIFGFHYSDDESRKRECPGSRKTVNEARDRAKRKVTGA